MNIQKVSTTNFKGYDARPLKGFYMSSNSHKIAEEMQAIGKKEGFKIYSKLKLGQGFICDEFIPALIPKGIRDLWAQDYWTFLSDKLLAFTNKYETYPICDYFKINYHETDKHISGGNMFIVNKDGEDVMLLGESELKYLSVKHLKSTYGVSKIYTLPQMDYHIDLFVRPLKDKKVLVADDGRAICILEKGFEKLLQYMKDNKKEDSSEFKSILEKYKNVMAKFKEAVGSNNLPNADRIVNILTQEGFEPIRVPGRIYEITKYPDEGTFLSHDCNYINANVFEKEDGDLVYITNKSKIDSLLGLNDSILENFDFSFEKEFIKSLSPYIKPEKIYFVSGDLDFIPDLMLKGMQGGIHCVCSEIPQNIGNLL